MHYKVFQLKLIDLNYLLEHSAGFSSELSSQSFSPSQTNAIGIHFLLAHVNCLREHSESEIKKYIKLLI